MSRATTWIAVGAGVLFGAALGWPSRQGQDGARASSTSNAEPNAASNVPSSTVRGSDSAAPAAASAQAADSATPVPTAASEPAADSPLASPHSHPVKTEGELRAAEVNCDGKVAADCIRAADGYEHGVVPRDEERITRHRKVGRTLYLRQCDSGDPVACYHLSRIYAEGDAVQKKPDTADAFQKRALDICQNKNLPACAEIKQLAGP